MIDAYVHVVKLPDQIVKQRFAELALIEIGQAQIAPPYVNASRWVPNGRNQPRLKPVLMHQFCLLALLFALVMHWVAGLHSAQQSCKPCFLKSQSVAVCKCF